MPPRGRGGKPKHQQKQPLGERFNKNQPSRGRGSRGGARGGRGGLPRRFNQRDKYAMQVDSDARQEQFGQRRQISSRIHLTVGGVPAAIGAQSLINELQQSTQIVFNFSSFDANAEAQKVSLTLESREHAEVLKALCGSNLSFGRIWIVEKNVKKTKSEQRVDEAIAAGFLLADQLVDLKQLNGTLHLDFNKHATVNMVFGAIKKAFPNITGLNLASNAIHSLSAVSQLLSVLLPGVVNLGLDSNRISKFNEVKKLAATNVRNLLLSGNPLANQPTYRREVAGLLPSLDSLDSQPCAPDRLGAPVPYFFEREEYQGLVGAFVNRYVTQFDNGRQALAVLYGSESLMTISSSLPYGTAVSNTIYQQCDHNLLNGLEKAANVAIGSASIVGLIQQLPATVHDVDSFRAESLAAVGLGGISITLHGRFKDAQLQRDLQFDHVLLIVPAPEGSPAKTDGWVAVIANQQLHVRL